MARDPRWPARFEGHVYPQTLPDPEEILPGAPSPWSTIASIERRGLSLDLVVERLKIAARHVSTPPGVDEPDEIQAVGDARRQPVTDRSAVLVALFEEEGETHVVMTRRSFDLRHHRGEIALPGGRSDAGETPVETALREAREEVGIPESEVDVVGWLSPIVTFASGSAIWPVIGLLPGRPIMVTDPAEVERAFTVSLADLLAEGTFLEERWRRGDNRPGVDVDGYISIYIFRVPGDLIWGATARVLTELLCAVTAVEWPEANRSWS
jgi:8-oxo-dGTP pyrophosphatase MutT (NUDIX family)